MKSLATIYEKLKPKRQVIYKYQSHVQSILLGRAIFCDLAIKNKECTLLAPLDDAMKNLLVEVSEPGLSRPQVNDLSHYAIAEKLQNIFGTFNLTSLVSSYVVGHRIPSMFVGARVIATETDNARFIVVGENDDNDPNQNVTNVTLRNA